MYSSIDVVGTLKKFKEDSKMKGYDENESKNGEWVFRKLNCMARAGFSTVTLSINGGKKKDESNTIYTMSAGTKDTKAAPIQIPFKDRFLQENIDKVATFRKFILDLRPYEFKKIVRDLKKAVDDGDDFTDEQLKALGVATQAEGMAKYDEYQAMHHEYLAEWDFAEAVNNLINDEQYANTKFRIRGNADYSYGDKKKIFYENFIPNHITIVDDDTEESATQTLDFIYGGECINVNEAEQRIYVAGVHFEYVQSLKKQVPIPVTIALPTNTVSEKKIEDFKSKFTGDEDDRFYQRAIVVDVINGSPFVKLSHEKLMEMITDDERNDYENGWLDDKDLMEKYAGSGARAAYVRELWFKKFGKDGNTASATTYTEDDLIYNANSSNEDDVFGDMDSDI